MSSQTRMRMRMTMRKPRRMRKRRRTIGRLCIELTNCLKNHKSLATISSKSFVVTCDVTVVFRAKSSKLLISLFYFNCRLTKYVFQIDSQNLVMEFKHRSDDHVEILIDGQVTNSFNISQFREEPQTIPIKTDKHAWNTYMTVDTIDNPVLRLFKDN